MTRLGALRARIAAGVLLGLGLAAGPAAAYRCTEAKQGGPSLAWDDREVSLRLVPQDGDELDLADITAVVEQGLAEWSAPDCTDVVLRADGEAADPRAGFDWGAGAGNPPNENIVVFRSGEGGDDGIDDWLHPATALAITTVTFVRSSGRILDADIEVNDGAYEFTDCDPPCVVVHDAANMMAHELGHVLGLDHPLSGMPDAPEATMFASAPAGETQKRDLSRDDVDGLCAIYPAGEDNGECTGTPRQAPPDIEIREAGCQQAGGSAGFAALAVLAGAALRRRRSRTGR